MLQQVNFDIKHYDYLMLVFFHKEKMFVQNCTYVNDLFSLQISHVLLHGIYFPHEIRKQVTFYTICIFPF
jgi:hypothetical protein